MTATHKPNQPAARVTRTILDTHLDDGRAFIAAAVSWLGDPSANGVLHYVALCTPEELIRWHRVQTPANPASTPLEPYALSEELHAACASALPGHQRLLLAQGRVSLTLCVGSLQRMLSEQAFQADTVFVPLAATGPTAASRWDAWAVQMLSRRCRRGTVVRLQLPPDLPEQEALRARFQSAGFEWSETPGGLDGTDVPDPVRVAQAVFAPRWALRSTRQQQPAARSSVQRCAVVGAGLAGASVAHALALRGWQVTVLDAASVAASGASGLPVGLVVAPVSLDDNPRSRLARVGARLTLQHARRFLQRGHDWNDSGVLELDSEAAHRLEVSQPLVQNGWLQAGTDRIAQAGWGAGPIPRTGLWHLHAGWIQPARLVHAWLNQPAIRFTPNTNITGLRRQGTIWELQNAQGHTVAEAELVVVANAKGALPLLQSLAAPWSLPPGVHAQLLQLQALHGTVSHGPMPADGTIFPPFAVNGHGSLIAHVPTAAGPRWYAGATYATDEVGRTPVEQHHATNIKRLEALLPAVATTVASQFADQQVSAWSGTRCVSHDRLPLVGPVHQDASSGLWLSLAMGSRGLTFAALCAELLAARLAGEPLPVDARLARSLDLHSPRRTRQDA